MMTKERVELLDSLVEACEVNTGFALTSTGRKIELILAKKAFCYVAREIHGYKLHEIAERLGYGGVYTGHDTVRYHVENTKAQIDFKDRIVIDSINNSFNLDILEEGCQDPKSIRIRELEAQVEENKRLTPLIDILNRVPPGKVWEVRERLELFLKGYSFKHQDVITEYTAADTEMIGIF